MDESNTSKLSAYLLLFLFICSSCKKDAELINVPNSFQITDKNFQKIKDLEDRRENEKILDILRTGDPDEKFYAVKATASTQDSMAFPLLVEILEQDQPEEVKAQAAFSIGQLRGRKHDFEKLKLLLPVQSSKVQLLILEALGKKGAPEELGFLLKQEQTDDTLIQLGKCRGIYRMGLRNLITTNSIRVMIGFLGKSYPSSVRIMASNFFARVRSSDIMDYQEALISSLSDDPSPGVRMNIATSLAAGKGQSTRSALLNAARSDSDFRVRVNCIQSLRNGQFSLDSVFCARMDQFQTVNERIACSEWINAAAGIEDIDLIWTLMGTRIGWRTRGNLFRSLLSLSSSKRKPLIVHDIQRSISIADNDYEVSDLLRALSKYPPAHKKVFEYVGNRSLGVVINAAAMGSLYSMTMEEDFFEFFDESELDKTMHAFSEYFRYAVLSGDPTMIGYGAMALRNEEIDWMSYLNGTDFLEAAKSNLNLPAETETLYELDRTMAFLKGEKFEYPEPKYSHAPDWNEIEANALISKAIVKTNKGKFEIELDWISAPLSVSNFVSLSRSGFFDQTRFHRVENNFVVQGGCPRGDGWGSPGYSIRSEFAPTYYRTGSVGMASAGKDTEGSQWFVTHYPSSHLDGKYTNFGIVREMDVVYQLEVGDTILGIELIQ